MFKGPLNPYVGPRPFAAGEPLFGRDREVLELRYLLTAERIVLLYSPSGAGKSSLVNAGLLDELKDDFAIWGSTRVNTEPPAGVANRFVWSAVAGLAENAKEPPVGLQVNLKEYVDRRKGEANPLIIFDQFEEILRIDPTDTKPKREFFEQLGDMLRDADVWALFVLREDYLAPLDPYTRLIPTHFRNRYRLDRLTKSGAAQAIEKPTANSPRKYASGVVEGLVEDLATVKVPQLEGPPREEAGEYVEPLQLQVVCFDLWQRMKSDDFSIDPEDVGDLSNALSNYYASGIAAVLKKEKGDERAVRKWFHEELITPDKIRNQVRRDQHRVGSLDYLLAKALEDTYLVRKEPRGTSDWYELSHDRLIAPVLDDNAKWFEEHLSELQKRAELWEKEQRNPGLLTAEKDSSKLDQWEQEEQAAGAVEQRYLKASREQLVRLQSERRQARWLRIALVGAVIGLAAAVAGGWYAYRKQIEAEVMSLAALNSASEAKQQKANAEGFAQQARDKALEAGNERDQATTAKADALTEKGHALDALAKAAVAEGTRLFESGHSGIAMAYFARALRASRDYRAGVAWISDLLTNNDWWILAADPLLYPDGSINARFSEDGRRVVTFSNNASLRVWDAATGIPVGPQITPKFSMTAAGVSADGKLLVTAAGKLAQVWNADTGKAVGVAMEHPELILSVRFSPDGRRVVSGCFDGTARVWNFEATEPLLVIERGSSRIAEFSPDGKQIISAFGNAAQVWDATTGKPVGVPMSHDDQVMSAAMSRDGKRVVTASRDKKARVWDFQTGLAIGAPMQHGDIVVSAAFSPDGQQVVTASSDQTARVWDAKTGMPIGGPLEHGARLTSAAFTPDGERVLTASLDSTPTRVWRRWPRWLIKSRPIDGSPNRSRVLNVANWLFTVTDHAIVEIEPKPGTSSIPGELSISPDERSVVTVWRDKTQLWNGTDGSPVASLVPSADGVVKPKFSLNGHLLVTTYLDGTVRVWHTETGKLAGAPLKHKKRVSVTSFSADGRLIATSVDGVTRVWNIETGRVVNIAIQQADSYVEAVSSDGRRLLTVSDDDVARLWDLLTGKQLGESVRHYGNSVRAEFSLDGQFMTTASGDGTVRMWDTDTGKPIGAPKQYDTGGIPVRFAADGRFASIKSSRNKDEWVWNVLLKCCASDGEANRLATLAEAVAGYEVSESGSLAPVDASEQWRRLTGLQKTTDRGSAKEFTVDWTIRRFAPK